MIMLSQQVHIGWTPEAGGNTTLAASTVGFLMSAQVLFGCLISASGTALKQKFSVVK